MTNTRFRIACGLAALCLAPAAPAEEATKYRAYFGTYTRSGGSEGIYFSDFDPRTGELSEPKLAGKAVNPSFVALDPSYRFLYAVGEVSELDGKRTGGVSAFSVDPETGDLTLLNQQPSKGAGPCHVIVDPQGKNVLAANYGGGSAVVLPVKDDGSLGEASGFVQHEGSSVNPARQKEPHAHSINLDKDGKRAFVADLGLDKVLIYDFDPKAGTIKPNEVPYAEVEPGSGPRHFDFHPNGKYAYVINELLLTMTAFKYDADTGKLEPIQTLPTVPERAQGYSTAEVRVHPSGKFVYGSNRGHDSIAMFRIDESNGELTFLGTEPTGGKTPRNFNIDPTGKFLLAANQNSDNVVVFRIDQETGKLEPTGHEVKVSSPVCVRFMPVK